MLRTENSSTILITLTTQRSGHWCTIIQYQIELIEDIKVIYNNKNVTIYEYDEKNTIRSNSHNQDKYQHN